MLPVFPCQVGVRGLPTLFVLPACPPARLCMLSCCTLMSVLLITILISIVAVSGLHIVKLRLQCIIASCHSSAKAFGAESQHEMQMKVPRGIC